MSLRVPLIMQELHRDVAVAEGKEMTNAMAAVPRKKIFAFMFILPNSLV